MPVCVAYLGAIYAFVKARYKVKIPFALLFLVWARWRSTASAI